MRRTILLAAVAFTLSAVERRSMAHVWDSSLRRRPSSRSSRTRRLLAVIEPVAPDVHRGVALPDCDTLVGVEGAGKRALVNVANGTTETLPIENVTARHASPGGAAFAARSGDRLHVVSKNLASRPVPRRGHHPGQQAHRWRRRSELPQLPIEPERLHPAHGAHHHERTCHSEFRRLHRHPDGLLDPLAKSRQERSASSATTCRMRN
jgi:hypothetical protein